MEKTLPIDRKSSIEREPRTINIDLAREQARYVLKTRSVEEALKVFTKGLQPVTCCGSCESNGMTNMDDELCCLPSSPSILVMRKIASAPF